MDEKQYNSQDQVNFVGLKNFVYAFLQEFFKFVAFTQIVLRKKLIYLIIGAILGIAVGLIYYYNKPQVYKASMTAIFNKLTPRPYGLVLDNLNALVTSGSHSRLAEQLKIPLELANRIIAIEGKNAAEKPLSLDTTIKNYQIFRVHVILTAVMPVDTLETALINHFNNLPYLKKMREVEAKYLEIRLQAIESDAAKLDSLKSSINRFVDAAKVPSTVYNNAINPATIYQHTTSLNNQRDSTYRLLYIENSPVSVVDSFNLIKVPRVKQLPDLLLVVGSIGLFTGFLFGLLLETKNQVLPSK